MIGKDHKDPQLLVALCTYNPATQTISRTLEALRCQTLGVASWDLVLIDNASTNRVVDSLDMAWHPRARVVREDQLGTSMARKRAFSELLAGRYSNILFVDDDTVLDPSYLEDGLEEAIKVPKLGCWGGQLLPEYAADPPAWFSPFAKYLALASFDKDVVTDWASYSGNNDVLPPSAGLFAKSQLVGRFVESFSANPLRQTLGAKGETLLRGEDTDFALFALRHGYNVARMNKLRLTHIIPAERLTVEYMARHLRGSATSRVIVNSLNGLPLPARPGFIQALKHRWQILRLPEPQARFFAAELKGRREGLKIIERYNQSSARSPC